MNAAKLQQISGRSKHNQAIFKALANRERPRMVTDLKRLKLEILNEAGVEVTREAILDIFHDLQMEGLGKLIRRKNPRDSDRFKWTHNPIIVGRAALGLVSETSVSSPPKYAPSHLKMSVAFPVRGEILNLELPLNMTKTEADDIASFIKRFAL